MENETIHVAKHKEKKKKKKSLDIDESGWDMAEEGQSTTTVTERIIISDEVELFAHCLR